MSTTESVRPTTSVPADATAGEALAAMDRLGRDWIVVTRDGLVAGAIDRDTLARRPRGARLPADLSATALYWLTPPAAARTTTQVA